eukprot:3311426-Rhodomonas_salina.1
MHHLTTTLGLTHSMGEPLFGTYPGLTPLWKHSEAGRTSVPKQSNWLLLSAVPPDDMELWLVTLIDQGGGVVASTTLLNMLSEVSHRLRTRSLAYGQVTVSTGLLRQSGWWKSGDTKTGKGKQALHLWLFRPEAEIAKFERAIRWLGTAFTSTLYPLETGGRGRSYWAGSEAGRLGLYDGSRILLASYGSAGSEELGTGYTIRNGGQVMDWNGMVEGMDEQ